VHERETSMQGDVPGYYRGRGKNQDMQAGVLTMISTRSQRSKFAQATLAMQSRRQTDVSDSYNTGRDALFVLG
jgi:hypothetical protein